MWLCSLSPATWRPAQYLQQYTFSSIGLYGNRGDGFRSVMGRVSPDFLPSAAFSNHFLQYPVAFAARDRLKSCSSPVIYLISYVQEKPRCSHQTSCKSDEGLNKLEILRLLNSETLRSDPANSNVPVLEFLSFMTGSLK